MARILDNPDGYINLSFQNAKGKTECVEFITQTLMPGVNTSHWREGIKVRRLKTGERDPVARGTAIATFVDGIYPKIGDTGMHAAIYLGQNAEGIQVMDQWRSQGKVLPRTIPWIPRRPGFSNDGNTFSVID